MRAGMEILQRIELFAGAHQLDRLAGHRAHGERRAAAAVAVDPGQHDAGQADPLVEGAGEIDRVLAGQAVGDEEDLVRMRGGLHLRRLGHHRLVEGGAAGGVEHDHVVAAEPAGLDGAARDLHRALPGDDRQGIDADLLAEHRELLHRRRTPGVEGGHQRLAPHLLVEAPRDLGGGGGLAGALQPDHHDRHRRRGIEVDRIGGGAERLDELVMDDLDDHLAGGDRLHDLDADGAFAHPVDEGAHHVEGDIGFQQRAPDLPRRRVDIGRGERAAARQPVENAGQLVGQAFEHRSTPPRCQQHAI